MVKCPKCSSEFNVVRKEPVTTQEPKPMRYIALTCPADQCRTVLAILPEPPH